MPARMSAIEDQLKAAALYDFLAQFDAPKATLKQLGRVHAHSCVEGLLKTSPTSGWCDLMKPLR